MQFSRISALALVVVLADFSIALPVSKGGSLDALSGVEGVVPVGKVCRISDRIIGKLFLTD